MTTTNDPPETASIQHQQHHGTGKQLTALFVSLAEVQAEMGGVIERNREVKVTSQRTGASYSFSYATLDAIYRLAIPLLAKRKMALLQYPRPASEGLELVTMLTHPDGAILDFRMPLRVSGNDVQDLGKAITYMRRYVIQGILGLAAEEDTDGPPQRGEDGRKTKPRKGQGQGQGQKPAKKKPAKDEGDQMPVKKKSGPTPEQQAEIKAVRAMLADKRREMGEDLFLEVVGREPRSLSEGKAACIRIQEYEEQNPYDPNVDRQPAGDETA